MEQSEILLISIIKHLFFSWCNIIFIKVSGKTTKKNARCYFFIILSQFGWGDTLLLSFLLNFKNSYASSVSIRGSLDIENHGRLTAAN